MQLHFELGDPETPRGHAILFARISGNPQRVIATYCVLLPIQFSIGKYLPPILSGQMPLEGLGDASAPAAVPIPPMLEDVAGSASLRQPRNSNERSLSSAPRLCPLRRIGRRVEMGRPAG